MIAARSTALWIIILLAAIDCSFSVAQPLRLFDVTEFIPLEHNPLVVKLRKFLDTKEENPQILMLGSSLILFPSTRTDEMMDGKAHRYDQWFIRHRVSGDTVPRYFVRELQRTINQPVLVANLGVQGSIISDQLLILRKALECGKTPKVVILELAPRSMLDNMHKVVTSTPVYQVLGDFSTAPPLWQNGKLNEKALLTIPTFFSYYYKVKADYRTLLANIVASALNRPMNAWEAKEGIRRNKLMTLVNPEMEWQVSEKPLFPKYHDLAMYKSVYNPPDEDFFRREQADCLKLIALAKSARIKIVVLDMPLTVANRQLLSPVYQNKYTEFIKSLETDGGVDVVHVAEDPAISDRDFEDSAHLNAAGGKRLFALLCSYLEKLSNSGEITFTPINKAM